MPSLRQPLPPEPTSRTTGEGTLGAAPRYTTNTNYSTSAVGIVENPSVATTAPSNALGAAQAQKEEAPVAARPPSPGEDLISDRYALLGGEDSENDPALGINQGQGLATIPEEDTDDGVTSLKAELLFLGGKKKEGTQEVVW